MIIDVQNPATGEDISSIPVFSASDVSAAANRAAEAARQAAIAIFMEAKNYEDILDFDEKFVQDIYMSGSGRVLDLKDRVYQHSIHNWSRRMHDEVNEKVQDIIVTLELGDNKADLDRMLSEL